MGVQALFLFVIWHLGDISILDNSIETTVAEPAVYSTHDLSLVLVDSPIHVPIMPLPGSEPSALSLVEPVVRRSDRVRRAPDHFDL